MSLFIGSVCHWDEERGYGELAVETPPNHAPVPVFRGAFAGLPPPALGQRFLFEPYGDAHTGLTLARLVQAYPG